MSEVITLEEVCVKIVDCEHKTAPAAVPGTEYGYLVGTPHIRNGRILLEAAKRVDKETYADWTVREVPRSEDLILAREAPVGQVGRITHGERICLGQRTVLLRPDSEKVDPRYLHYLLLSPSVQEVMASKAAGSTVAHLNVKDIRGIPLPSLPARRYQLAVAQLLAALDDKIAVNERIATTAADLADTEFLRVASGLTFGEETFGSVAEVVGGGTPITKVDDYWGGDICWATPSDVTALSSPYLFETSRNITKLGLENCASRLYPAQSIFMTSRATIGAFALPQTPAAVNQGFIVVLPPSEEMRWWLWHEMRARVDEMISLANGSTFLELSRKNFKAMRIRLPSATEVTAFARRVAPLHSAAAHAAQENRALATLRDTLLPLLMSGRLRVKDAEKIVEDAT